MITSMTVTGNIEIQERMRNVLPSAILALVESADKMNALLASYIIEGKLMGQVLERRTGVLASSIKVIAAVHTDDAVTGGVEQDDSIAPYGKYHERGARVPARVGNPVMHWKNALGEDVFARRARGFRLPKRSFMASALRDYRELILGDFKQTVAAAITDVWAARSLP